MASESADKQKINLIVGGNQYPLTVNRSKEEAYREAGRILNEKYSKYNELFSGKGDKTPFDFLAMAAIDIATRYVELQKTTDTNELIDKLRLMYDDLERYIQKSKVL